MITVRLQGGLGNQMFQYAAGRALALQNQVPLRLDLRWFAKQSKRNYELGYFRINANTATVDELRSISRWEQRGWNRLRRVMSGLCPSLIPSLVRDRDDVRFCPQVLDAGRHAYLDGYFQSERYFGHAADVIRKELTPRSDADGQNASILERITSERDPVCVHVRRGDYVSDPSARIAHAALPLGYYHSSVDALHKRVGSAGKPSYFVFSDDPEWARASLRFDSGPMVFVSHNSGSEMPHEDLRLMSACRHFIIANSTFSWWAAWLSPQRDGTVIAPRRWFANSERDSTDLIPERWMRV